MEQANPRCEVKQLDKDFSEILTLIQEARHRVYKSINTELISLYWQVGEYIHKKIESSNWGEGVIEALAQYLKAIQPNIKGFSNKNLWRMKQFYAVYHQQTKLSALLRELTWTNNLLIMSKTKTFEEKEFYIKLAIKDRYSSRELERQIDSGYFERTVLSDKKLPAAIQKTYQQVEGIFKDSYMLEFLNLPSEHSEQDLRLALVGQFKDFILELGRDFTFIGQEYRVQVGNKDFYIDLLFYHRGLQCLAAFELKIDDFKPEYLGKLNFYLEALDRDVKKPNENPSVGIILCKSKDDEVVEYALSRNLSPTLIAEYKTQLIDKKVLQNKLHELFQMQENRTEGIEAFYDGDGK